ncbi:VanZ family protein [Nocardioides mangrovicus]|uniref:VanZ family protein n=1 Tax=Nocardioides mangrovicus TaxID=2478913 RepID=A0A3L8NZX4_9ACTN|nr:VanZ family protein [Nocardioides mangrovicus]
MLPVVVPLGVAVVTGSVWHLRRHGRLTLPRAGVALAVGLYAAGIVANTVFPIYLDKPARAGGWISALNLVPLAGYEIGDAVMNIGVFVPVGVLLSLVLPPWAWWRVLVAAASLSLAIEVSQLVTAHLLAGGHIADVNDLIFNVVGAAIGLALLSALSRTSVAARLIDRCDWSPPVTARAGRRGPDRRSAGPRVHPGSGSRRG